jgi:hypothetical protein
VRHLSRGFKDLALKHIKTSREVVGAHYKQLAEQKSIDADTPDVIDQDAVLRGHVEAVGGMPRVSGSANSPNGSAMLSSKNSGSRIAAKLSSDSWRVQTQHGRTEEQF